MAKAKELVCDRTLELEDCWLRCLVPIPTKPPGYNGIMPPGIPE
jgi:hypothetical protein